MCLMDAAALLRRGRRCALRALLAARRILAREDARYLLNPLFLTDYCVWLQALGEGEGGGVAGTEGDGLAAEPASRGDALLFELGSQLASAAAALTRDAPGLAHWRLARVEQFAGEGIVEGVSDEGGDDKSSDDESSDEDSNA